jgi:hypothetical protein
MAMAEKRNYGSDCHDGPAQDQCLDASYFQERVE